MTAHSLLSAVLADPFDDLPRLILADWLEENGDPERATIIRYQICKPVRPPYGGWGCQCGVPNARPPCNECLNATEEDVEKADNANAVLRNWDQQYYDAYSKCRNFEYEETAEIGGVKVNIIYRRGFPDEIRCTMAQWIGTDECRSCGSFSRSLGIPAIDFCLTCHGTGRTPGIAKAVCEAWPVMRVSLSDKRPAMSGYYSGLWRWYTHSDDGDVDSIGDELFAMLPDSSSTPEDAFVTYYGSLPESLSALSHAALTYGRRLAGLPELKQG